MIHSWYICNNPRGVRGYLQLTRINIFGFYITVCDSSKLEVGKAKQVGSRYAIFTRLTTETSWRCPKVSKLMGSVKNDVDSWWAW